MKYIKERKKIKDNDKIVAGKKNININMVIMSLNGLIA